MNIGISKPCGKTARLANKSEANLSLDHLFKKRWVGEYSPKQSTNAIYNLHFSLCKEAIKFEKQSNFTKTTKPLSVL